MIPSPSLTQTWDSSHSIERSSRLYKGCKQVNGFLQLPTAVIARADVSDFAIAHQIVERAQRLRQRRRAIPAVYLVQIDIVCTEPFQTRFHTSLDVFTAK